MSAPSAFRIEQAMAAALSFRDRLREEVGDDTDALLSAMDSETDVFDLLRRVLRAADENKRLSKMTTERLKDLQDRKHRFESREEAARGLAYSMIVALDLPGGKFIDPEVSASCGVTKDKVTVPDPSAAPDEYVEIVTSRVPLMDKIKAYVDAADEMPNWVQIVPGAPTITVRVK